MRPAQHLRLNRLALPLLGVTAALGACAPKAPNTPPPPPISYAEAILYNGTGQRMGTLSLLPQGGTLQGTLQLNNGALTPGAHGMHIHAVGKCTPPDFTSAGAHLNPGNKQHGMENPEGPHEGDLPSLVANEAGGAQTSFTVNASFDELFDVDGAAFVIHADPDDMKTDPSGNSGARVLCGVIYRKQR